MIGMTRSPTGIDAGEQPLVRVVLCSDLHHLIFDDVRQRYVAGRLQQQFEGAFQLHSFEHRRILDRQVTQIEPLQIEPLAVRQDRDLVNPGEGIQRLGEGVAGAEAGEAGRLVEGRPDPLLGGAVRLQADGAVPFRPAAGQFLPHARGREPHRRLVRERHVA